MRLSSACALVGLAAALLVLALRLQAWRSAWPVRWPLLCAILSLTAGHWFNLSGSYPWDQVSVVLGAAALAVQCVHSFENQWPILPAWVLWNWSTQHAPLITSGVFYYTAERWFRKRDASPGDLLQASLCFHVAWLSVCLVVAGG